MPRALSNPSTASVAPRWMRITLWLAAGYNIVWGGLVIAFPFALFDALNMPRPTYPQIWQCVGMIVAVYGLGYAIAAADPLRWWPLVLVGLVGKVLGPLGFAQALYEGTLPLRFGVTIITNDLIWWLPFTVILWHAWKESANRNGAKIAKDGPILARAR